MGLNEFTDVAEREFNAQYARLVVPEEVRRIVLGEMALLEKDGKGNVMFTRPEGGRVDWSCLASPVISQGVCGASYAIAPLESIEITSRANGISASYLSIQ